MTDSAFLGGSSLATAEVGFCSSMNATRVSSVVVAIVLLAAPSKHKERKIATIIVGFEEEGWEDDEKIR
jgi:hypothetical protein